MEILIQERRKYLTSGDQKLEDAKSLSELSPEELHTVAKAMEERNEVLYAENKLLKQILFGSKEYGEEKPGLMDAIRITD